MRKYARISNRDFYSTVKRMICSHYFFKIYFAQHFRALELEMSCVFSAINLHYSVILTCTVKCPFSLSLCVRARELNKNLVRQINYFAAVICQSKQLMPRLRVSQLHKMNFETRITTFLSRNC